MARHHRITLDEIFAAHEAALRFGGRPGVHDQRLIESAITRPYTGYYRQIAQKAAALLQSLATNHGFVDGNKRTAIFAMNLLLGESGYRLRGEHEFERHNAEVEERSWPWSSAG